MPINIPTLKNLAEDREFQTTTQTIKKYKTDFFHIEINFSHPQKVWIGFSICVDSRAKYEKGKNIKKKCEAILLKYEETLLHNGNELAYKQKGNPGEPSSYIFYSIKCPFIASKALDRLELLESHRAELELLL